MPERVAAIDVGSNAIRFFAAEAAEPKGYQVVAETRFPVRLGHGVFSSGLIEESAAAEAAAGLSEAARHIKELAVGRYRAVATSAVRDSRNRRAFVRQVREASGLRLEVISGSEELRLVHAAVRTRTVMGRDPWIMVELGGGSVEIGLADDSRLHWSETHAMGAVRLMEMFTRGSSEPREFSRLVQEYVATIRLPARMADKGVKGFLATGGNIDSVARICRGTSPSNGSLTVAVKEVRELIGTLSSLTAAQRQERYDLRADRADVIVPAAIVYAHLAERFGVEEIVVPGGGVREGIVLDMLARRSGRREAGESTLQDSALSIGRKFLFDEKHAQHVAHLAASLYDQLAALHGLGPRERRLLVAAALLHDVGGVVSLKSHHKHALYLITKSELPGFTAREMFLVGVVARYHRKAPPTSQHREFAQLSLADRNRVRLLAGILRVADALDKEHRQKIRDVRVVRGNGEVRITAQGAEDILLEQWALKKKDDLFREAFGVAVTLSPDDGVPRETWDMSESDTDLGDPRLFIDRELSLLDFFYRVLEEAQDPTNPLLERVRFLAITSSNLAEFFMVRVAGLKQQIEAGVGETSLTGATPAQQLEAARDRSQDLMQKTRRCLRELVPLLEESGIHVADYAALPAALKAEADGYFQQIVFPVLTPLAVDPGRPFPHISNMSLNLALVIRDAGGGERFARVKLPATLPRFLELHAAPAPRDGSAGPGRTFLPLEQLVAANVGSLFPGMEIVQSHPFRVTRDAEVSIQELEAEDLLETIEKGVRQRRFGRVVRLTVDPAMPSDIREILSENLEITSRDVYTMEPPLGMSDLEQLHSLDRADLKYPSFVPAPAPGLLDTDADIFTAIRRQDILLHHPYDSFDPVADFLEAAARDPGVLAIKQTLYRVGQNSPVVKALLEAVRRGKQVAVLLELKARFDEESNIEWARALESEGVHVVYGLLGLKTHSKIALVVRQDADRIRRYVHLSTGNYNAVTAHHYTDLGLLTCDDDFGADASDVFNYLTGYSDKRAYRRFLVAPIGLRSGLEALIRREMEHARSGGEGHLIFKINAIVDRAMIQLLYEASRAGVRIDMLVRGMCCLRPGLPGVSETITVRSVVGRFLEHSRIFWFRNGGKEEVFLGSADLMGRNLDRRVEILFPVRDPRLVSHIRTDVLDLYLRDTVKARIMSPDGTYHRAAAASEPVDAQAELIRIRQGAQRAAP